MKAVYVCRDSVDGDLAELVEVGDAIELLLVVFVVGLLGHDNDDELLVGVEVSRVESTESVVLLLSDPLDVSVTHAPGVSVEHFVGGEVGLVGELALEVDGELAEVDNVGSAISHGEDHLSSELLEGVALLLHAGRDLEGLLVEIVKVVSVVGEDGNVAIQVTEKEVLTSRLSLPNNVVKLSKGVLFLFDHLSLFLSSLK